MQHIGIFLIFAASVKSAGVYTSVKLYSLWKQSTRSPHLQMLILHSGELQIRLNIRVVRGLASKCNAKIHYNGTEEYFKVGKYRVGLHNSSHGGGKTIHINYNNREKLYKIRSK